MSIAYPGSDLTRSLMPEETAPVAIKGADNPHVRIAELEAALRQIRADLDSSEDIPTTCALIANKIDDLLANRDG